MEFLGSLVELGLGVEIWTSGIPHCNSYSLEPEILC